jgi:phosphate acetyltransferase
MKNPLDIIKERAKQNPKKIVYPEGDDPRVIHAVRQAKDSGIINGAVLLGDIEIIKAKAKEEKIDISDFELINPKTSDRKDEFANIFYELRKHKGIDLETAKKAVTENLNFAGLYTRARLAHGFVGGSVNTTADTVRAALYTIGLGENISTLSSFFIMYVPNNIYGDKGLFLFADCGVIPEPSPRQLANIAYTTSQAYKSLFDLEARCALLSYSTKGSAQGEAIERIRKGLEIIKEKYPDVIADGEMQLDAAIVPEVAKIKVKESPVAGRANVLIFPDLNSGNIAYKLTQRLGNAEAIGPILTGLKYPANDLSRGCSVEDIVAVTAVTVLQ